MSPVSSTAARSSPNGEMPAPSNTKTPKEQLSNQHMMPGDKLQTELDLERGGRINALQRFRSTQSENLFCDCPDLADYSDDLLNTEQELREVVQEEISIREELGCDSATTKRLEFLSTEYQVLARAWWFYRSNLEPSGQERAFELWRSNPQWYMHSELVKDCAGQQGCCARKCGCCLNRKIDASRSLGRGHCTLECGCCAKARGSQFSESQKADLKKLSMLGERGYRSFRISALSIFGIFANSRENPFDMIIAPPSYEESEASKKASGIVKAG